MKFIIIFVLVCASYCSFAQKFTANLKNAFKSDDAVALLSEVKEQKTTINACFDIEETSYSLLALSIRMESPKIFAALITQKADVDKVCSDKTPLMYAAKYGKLEMAKFLVNAGANLKIVNQNKETALDYAIRYKNKEVGDYLSALQGK